MGKKFLKSLESDVEIDTDVFISFSSKNLKFAERVYVDLEKKKIKSWISSKSIVVGDEYFDQIMQAIEACGIFILIVSNPPNKSARGNCLYSRGII